MTRTKALTAERHKYEAKGHDFLITKDANRYAKYYLVDPVTLDYLTGRPHTTLFGAQSEADAVAHARNASQRE